MEENITAILTKSPLFIYSLVSLLAAALVGYLASFAVFKTVKIFLRNIREASSTLINKKLRLSLQLLFTVIALNVTLPFATLSPRVDYYLYKIFYISLIISFTFLLIKVTEFIKDLLYVKFDVNVQDNLDERKARTQIDFLQKLMTVVLVFIAAAIILMSFERVRELGASILASAGIAGILIGLAAQKSIANLLAGFQIAFTQPIRLDDVVVVEGEWGRIEEITLTYVVVKIWDLRRLVLPISYFLEKPFQNWTRVSSEILGAVFIYADYTVPVNALRTELARILKQEAKHLWDEKVGVLQVTNTNDKGVELRILVSAVNSGINFELRCLVREQIVTYLQTNYPDALPRIRMEQQPVRTEPETVKM